MKAAFSGKRESVRLLLEAGADTNLKSKDGYTALINTIKGIASNKEQVEIIKQLLDHNANIDEQDSDGETALIKAVGWYRQRGIIALLLESGADPTIKDNKGRTAADIARSRNEGLAKFIESWQSKNIKGANN